MGPVDNAINRVITITINSVREGFNRAAADAGIDRDTLNETTKIVDDFCTALGDIIRYELSLIPSEIEMTTDWNKAGRVLFESLNTLGSWGSIERARYIKAAKAVVNYVLGGRK